MKITSPTVIAACIVLAASVTLTACSGASNNSSASNGGAGTNADAGPDLSLVTPETGSTSSRATVLFAPGDPQASVAPDAELKVVAAGGKLTSVVIKAKDGTQISGALSPAADVWTSSPQTLPFGQTFSAQAFAVDSQGVSTSASTTFKVRNADLVSANISPGENAVVGVGMPIVVRFSRAPSDQAVVQSALSVSSTPAVEGAWGWVSDSEVHWRPKNYWPAGTDVTVRASLGDLSIGNDQTGSTSVSRNFRIGQATVIKVGIDTHQLTVASGGTVVRTIPITTGKEGFTTRSGIKVIMSKERTRIMDSVTVDIPSGSSEAYRLKVEYALRLTNSGEFIHAAPWSVGAQGRRNVSHGCTGMSTSNASWMYNFAKVGDPVEYTGSLKPMTLTNGYGDWNLSWNSWGKRSAAV